MRHRWIGLLVAAIALAMACGGSANRSEWAVEAEAWHDALIAAQIEQGGAAFARFLAPDVVLDDSAIIAPLVDEPFVWVQYAADTEGCFRRKGREAIQVATWLMGPESLRLEPKIFISVDGLVGFWFYDWAPLDNDDRPDTEDPSHGVSLMAPIGPLGVEYLVNAPAVDDWRDRRPDWPQADEVEDVAVLWAELWSGTRDDVDSLYAKDACLRDSIDSIDVAGRNAIAELASSTGTWEITTVGPDAVRGVYPLVRGSSDAKVLEEVALVVAGRDDHGCDGEMVVWLVLDEGLVVAESRYWPIERARRCLPMGDLPDGWWTDRPVPTEPPQATEDLENPTDPLMFGGATITVYNGSPNLNRLLAWGLGRFEAAGLTPPAVASATFTLYSEYCDDIRARHRPTMEGADLGFCFDESGACWDEDCPSFSLTGRRLVLHELAHAWMETNLDESARMRFADYVELDFWSGESLAWCQRAVEHASETIAWGLMDQNITPFQIDYRSPEQLSEGFRMLTGSDPLSKVAYLLRRPDEP